MSLTRRQRSVFAKAMLTWQHKLNLGDWRICPVRERTDALCQVRVEYADRLASWTLNGAAWDQQDSSDRGLEEIACHELLHVLLAELSALASSPQTVSLEQIDAAEHRIINTLTPLLVPKQ